MIIQWDRDIIDMSVQTAFDFLNKIESGAQDLFRLWSERACTHFASSRVNQATAPALDRIRKDGLRIESRMSASSQSRGDITL